MPPVTSTRIARIIDRWPRAILPGMFKRQTTGSVVCVSCGYLVGVNDDRCYTAAAAIRACGDSRPALRSLGHDLGFVPFVTGLCIVMYGLTLLQGGIVLGGGLFNLLPAEPDQPAALRRQRRRSGVRLDRWWTLLSAPGSTAPAAHLLQLMWIRQLAPAVGELYGPGRMVIIYTAAASSASRTTTLAGVVFGDVNIPIPVAWLDDGGRLGGDLRTARRARLLRPPVGSQPDSQPGDQLGDDRVRVRLSDSGHRQLRPRRRLPRRLPRGTVAGSAEARAHRPHGHRRRLSGASVLAVIVSVIHGLPLVPLLQ